MRPISERFCDDLFVVEPEMRPLLEAHLGGGIRLVGTVATIVKLVEATGARALGGGAGEAHEAAGRGRSIKRRAAMRFW